jgi:serine/threonine-protein kinase RsbT
MTLEETRVLIEREADVVVARQKGREIATALGFSGSDPTLIATAISEVAHNILHYATRGAITLSAVEQSGKRGIRVVAQDAGPGIADIESAMRDGYSTRKRLGLGLPGSKRLMDGFEIASAAGAGTVVTMEKWV